MKLISVVILFAAVAFLGSCTSQQEENGKTTVPAALYFGDSISGDGAAAATTLETLMAGKDSLPVKLSGKITEVCQKKGCWMDVEIGAGKTMRVSFKDYAFFVPKDAAGKTTVLDGYAQVDTISVEELRHYAEDAGKSKEEIEKITMPEVEITYEARGVIIQDEKK